MGSKVSILQEEIQQIAVFALWKDVLSGYRRLGRNRDVGLFVLD
jgi:hypothetical protein